LALARYVMSTLLPNPDSLKHAFALLPEKVAVGVPTKCGFCAQPVVGARHARLSRQVVVIERSFIVILLSVLFVGLEADHKRF